ncbi:SDR family oxidoreductase [Pseudomonas sp. Marseille-Q5115]|uniref:SDR family oxidoreductase n=1 Tax=Pseudomonas sp. Marseille-Q5115 TaxID=2866593 RepID=UPI001CE3EED9|nr:SDR family oxidoreductase [Pseudomonas sp. Marseille-Q5115]
MNTSNRKVAIITGASRGIGSEIAKRLSQEGFAVVVNYASSAPEADTLVATLQAQGGQALAVKANVASAQEVKRLFDEAEQHFGGVDVLVNNAGIMALATLAETDDDSVNRQIDINFKGTFNTLREAAQRMRDGGRVVNFSSSVVAMLQPTYGVYAGTKAAVEAMTSVFAKELRGRNITVNAVAPGPTATDLFLNGKPQDVVDRLSKLAPLERLGQPQDIAATVAFLASVDGSWINGQTLRANGGII